MKTEIDNPPAFPKLAYMAAPDNLGDSAAIYESDGISLRDYFAAKALTGFISNDNLVQTCIELAKMDRLTPEEVLSQRCYKFADAMLLERSKKPTTP